MPPPAAPPFRRGDFGFCLLLALLAVGLYGPAVGYEMINYDSPQYVGGALNPLRTWRNAVYAFTHFYFGQYSPLTLVSYSLDYAVAGRAPWIYKLDNLLQFIVTLGLAYEALRRLYGSAAARAASLLYAVHPLHVEPVVWIAERKGILSVLLGMGALVAAVRALEGTVSTRRWGVLAFGLWTAGLLAKGTLLPTALLALLYFALLRRHPWRTFWKPAIPFAVVTFGLVLFTLLYSRFHPDETSIQRGFHGGGPAATLRLMLPFWLDYWRVLLWPTGLELRPLAVVWSRFTDGPVLVAAAILALMAIGAIGAWRRGVRGCAFVFFGVYLWLSPVLGFLPTNAYFADRYWHGPLLLPCALAGVGWDWLARRSNRNAAVLSAALGIVLILLAAMTVRYRGAWADPETLWKDQLAKNPREEVYYSNLADHLLETGRTAEAAEVAQRGLKQSNRPDSPQLLTLAGMALDAEGRSEAAMAFYRRAQAIDPRSVFASRRLGELLLIHGDPPGALEALEAARRALDRRRSVSDPSRFGREDEERAQVEMAMGQALAVLDRHDRAYEAFERARRAAPRSWEAINGLALAAWRLGRTEEWARWAEESLRVAPDQPNAEGIGRLLERHRNGDPIDGP